MVLSPFQHTPAGVVSFGAGVAKRALGAGPLKKAAKVLVISDAGVERAGVLAKVLAGHEARIALTETGVMPDGDVAFTDALADRARAAGVDGILAVGGGSVIDTAKGVGACLASGKALAELEGIATVRARLLPFVAVPTTAGTGSEASQFAVIKDRAAGRKRIFMDAALVPVASFLDPELIVGLPHAVTAATGVDALSHAVEAIGSKMQNPIATALAVDAVRMLRDALPRALAEPTDVAARGACLVAANMAGQAISSAMLGACHAFAHALGAHRGVPHGVANGIFLGPVMRENVEAVRPAYAWLGQALGAPTLDGAAAFAIEEIERLVHAVAGIPRTLVGLADAADEDALTALTMGDADLATNPVAFDEALVRRVIRARFGQ